MQLNENFCSDGYIYIYIMRGIVRLQSEVRQLGTKKSCLMDDIELKVS